MEKYKYILIIVLLMAITSVTYCAFTTGVEKTGNITTVELSAVFVNNNDFLTKIQVLDSSITSIDKTTDLNRVTTVPSQTFTSDNLFSTTESKMPIYVWIENNTINYYSGATNIDLNNN